VKRPRPALVVLLVSVLVLVAAVSMLAVSTWQSRQQAEVPSTGSRDLSSLAALESATARPAPSPSATPSTAPSPSSSVASAAPSPTLIASASAPPLTAPVRVRIPRISVNAQVLPVGLDKSKALDIPEDITKVGWYELGVPPGADQGSAVLVAHRDGRVQGHGVFYNLGQLGVGDKVAVTAEDGTVLRYKVVARELISKKRLPLEELFAVDGPARLTLISCGGYYDRANGGYQDNIVVTAIPIGSA
jgi:LPXTG-site transpeptidase (sortase) family protein